MELELKNIGLELKLEKYNESRKNYYEKNKELVKEKAKQGIQKLSQENPDKLKEYRKNAYQKRKEKLKNIEKTNNEENF